MKKKLLVIIACCLGMMFAFSSTAGAAVEGTPCSAEPTDDVIHYGALIVCNIDPVGDSDTFRFSGTSGEPVVIQAARQSGVASPCIELFDPVGTPVGSDCRAAARLDVTLDQTGTHTILVTELNNDQVLSYALVLERVGPPSDFATAICPGCTINEEVNPVGDLDLFLLQGEAGDAVSIQAVRQGGVGSPCVELFDPTGIPIASQCGATARVDANLGISGPYSVLVTELNNDQTLPYGLTYQCIGSCPDPQERLFGDLNCDEDINIFDVIMLLQHIVGLAQISECVPQ